MKGEGRKRIKRNYGPIITLCVLTDIAVVDKKISKYYYENFKKEKNNLRKNKKNCSFIYDKSLINSSFDNFNCFLIEESVPSGISLGVILITVDFIGYFG